MQIIIEEMRRFKKIAYCFFVLLCIFFSTGFSNRAADNSEISEENGREGRKIAARVNGEPIYEDQLNPYIKKKLKSFQKYGASEASPDLLKHLKKKALNTVISQELIIQESQKFTIADIEKKINNAINKTKNMYPTAEHYEKSSAKTKLTVRDIRESLRKRIYLEEYLRKHGLYDPVVAEAEIRAFYDKNPHSFHLEETIKVRHILIKADEVDTEEKVKIAREKAVKIRNELVKGNDFAEMAKEYSECKSASGGGILGHIRRRFMPAEFDRVAFSLDKGELSTVVRTKFGFHIIQVLDKKIEGIAPYDEVKDFINSFLQEKLAKKKLKSHIEELKEKAKIEILLDES